MKGKPSSPTSTPPPRAPGGSFGRRRLGGGYRTSEYQRPVLSRLTPFTWLLIVLALLGLVAAIYVVFVRVTATQDSDELLSERLARATALSATTVAQTPAGVVVPATADPTSAPTQAPTAAPAAAPATSAPDPGTPRPAITPPPTPTVDPFGAAWQNQLVRQADGTLLAPDPVVARATADLTNYYVLLRDLPLDQYLARRDKIIPDFFAGTALDGIRISDRTRKQYPMNRGGQVEIRIRDFSANGLAATAYVRARGWVNDVYDVGTGRLIEKSRQDKDTLTIVRIIYDRADERWKFAIISQVMEVNTP